MAVDTPPQPSVNNLANQLTASRLLLSVILFVCIEFHLWIVCIVVFLLAAVTDWLDGYVARKHNLVSSLGRMFDPLVDKVIVCGAFILLLDDLPGFLQPWMVVLVVAREFIVTGIRGFMEQQGIAFGADRLGKIKMLLQSIALGVVFLVLALVRAEVLILRGNSLAEMGIGGVIVVILLHTLIYSMVVATAVSGLQYIWRAATLLRT